VVAGLRLQAAATGNWKPLKNLTTENCKLKTGN
jgi:hypothetical protein